MKVCLKTKFADGVGHLCNYCSVRCCARCGGKVTLRSNKVSCQPSCPLLHRCPGYLGLHTLPEEAGAADQVWKVDAGRQRLLAGGSHYAANRAGHGPHPRHPGLLLHRALGLHLISVLQGGTHRFTGWRNILLSLAIEFDGGLTMTDAAAGTARTEHAWKRGGGGPAQAGGLETAAVQREGEQAQQQPEQRQLGHQVAHQVISNQNNAMWTVM